MLTDQGDAENAVFTGRGEHFNKAFGSTFCNGSIEFFELEASDLIGYCLCFGFPFIEADTGNFGVDKSRCGNDAVIDLEFF